MTGVVIYEAADGWRWRMVAANGAIVAESGEAYTRREDAKRALVTVVEMFADHPEEGI